VDEALAHNGQFFTALAEVTEMCDQVEMIAAFIVQPVLLPLNGVESFAFSFGFSSMTICYIASFKLLCKNCKRNQPGISYTDICFFMILKSKGGLSSGLSTSL